MIRRRVPHRLFFPTNSAFAHMGVTCESLDQRLRATANCVVWAAAVFSLVIDRLSGLVVRDWSPVGSGVGDSNSGRSFSIGGVVWGVMGGIGGNSW